MIRTIAPDQLTYGTLFECRIAERVQQATLDRQMQHLLLFGGCETRTARAELRDRELS